MDLEKIESTFNLSVIVYLVICSYLQMPVNCVQWAG